MISLSINVSKIKKEKQFDGKTGKWLDLVLIETPDSEYGDYMVKQKGTKEEDMPIIGNAKVWRTHDKPDANTGHAPDDLPF